MYQFCYASQSTSDKAVLLDDLTNILAEAREFNYRHGLFGVLYFADGYFFQCLEGNLQDLEMLIDKLYTDPRHHHIKRFAMSKITQVSFSDWSMRYISKRDSIHQFCQTMGFEGFRPLQFEQQHIDALLAQLVIHSRENEHLDM